MTTEVVMPQMGESIAEGTITKWLKQVGDRVERDEPLFEISTDKVDAEIPSPAAGTLTEIRFKEGDTVEINTTVAVLDGGAAAGAAPATASGETAAKEAQPEQKQSEATAAKAQSAEVETPPAQPPCLRKRKLLNEIRTRARSGGNGATKPAAPRKETAPQPAQPIGNGGGAAASAEELRRKIESTRSQDSLRSMAWTGRTRRHGHEWSRNQERHPYFIESGAPAARPARATQAGPAIQLRCRAITEPAEGDRVEQMTVMRKKLRSTCCFAAHLCTVTTVYEIDIRILPTARTPGSLRKGPAQALVRPFIFQAVNNGLRRFPLFNAQVSGDQIIYKRDINLGMAVALDWG